MRVEAGRRIWVVLPTYNEAENIAPLVGAILSLDFGLRVVVVDDASPDGTAEIARGLARGSPRVHVIRREGERGLGTAYLAGFRRALDGGADAVLTMDCDFSHDPAAIPSLVAALDSARVVIGSRYVAGGRIENWGFYRKLLSATANRFVRALFDLPVRDCTSGFRLYRAEVLEGIPWQRVSSTGYSFLAESLYWAMRQDDGGARVREVPICFVDRVRGQSKMGAPEVFSGIINLLRLRVDLFRASNKT
ncbi:MAG TPA: polyprenol monophosphomannose synthase [Pyrinomonadaceae bacterium]|jgi:dolichol-phosphate mannosyltransferase|nr:polyprenol monophosphomannose synthase [Pyrinomonadaceae bacterium]